MHHQSIKLLSDHIERGRHSCQMAAFIGSWTFCAAVFPWKCLAACFSFVSVANLLQWSVLGCCIIYVKLAAGSQSSHRVFPLWMRDGKRSNLQLSVIFISLCRECKHVLPTIPSVFVAQAASRKNQTVQHIYKCTAVVSDCTHSGWVRVGKLSAVHSATEAV